MRRWIWEFRLWLVSVLLLWVLRVLPHEHIPAETLRALHTVGVSLRGVEWPK